MIFLHILSYPFIHKVIHININEFIFSLSLSLSLYIYIYIYICIYFSWYVFTDIPSSIFLFLSYL